MMPLSCFLFALYPILFLWSRNWEEVYFSEIAILIGIVLGSTIVIHQLFKLIFPTHQKATIATLTYLIMFISFDHFFYFYSPGFQFLHRKQLFGITIGRYAVLLPAWGALFLLLLFLIYKEKHNFNAIIRLSTGIALTLVVTTFPPLFSAMSSPIIPTFYNLPSPLNINTSLAKGTSTIGYLPNIYYIILDEYTRNDVLKEKYGFDNSNFTNTLKEHGFFVADKSCSNYAMTELSLPSFMTSTYVKKTKHHSPYEYLKQSNIIKFLKDHGYRYINVSIGGCAFSEHSELADEEPLYQTNVLGTFSRAFILKTFFGPFCEQYRQCNSAKLHVAIVLNQLNVLKRLSQEKRRPFVVFCHILCPHVPFVFNENGNARDKEILSGQDYFFFYQDSVKMDAFPHRKDAYVTQIKGLNKQVLKTVDEVLANETKKPIIIIHSDHGSKHSDPYRCINKMGKPTPTILKDRMSILNTYYFPHGGNQKLYSTITPVNTFRVLCNHYFDTKLELLPDTVHWSVYADRFSWTKFSPDQVNCLSFGEVVD